jgi:enamine deaminase RidA (YjgF/YER057c/UK114 family)
MTGLQIVRSAGPAAPIHRAEAVVAGPLVFTSAQLATDWVHGIAPEARVDPAFPHFESAVVKQTDYILRALSRSLQAAGSGLEHVVKAHVFLADCADFLGFDRVWNRYFRAPPTRTTVGAAGLLIPDARLEIAMIAIVPGRGADKRPATSDAPRPLTKKVEAMSAGDFVFTSGQLAHNARDGVPPEAAAEGGRPDVAKQAAYTLGNLGRSLAAAGASLEQVVKIQALLLDAEEQRGVETAWASAARAQPAYAAVGVGSLLVGGTRLEIDLTAYKGADPMRPIRLSGEARVQAVASGGLVFTAGILPGPLDGAVPAELVPHPAYPHYASAIGLQTEAVLARLKQILEAAGSGLDRVVKAQVFLTDLADFSVFDQIWREHFPVPPAQSVVQVSNLPARGSRIAVEAIAAA